VLLNPRCVQVKILHVPLDAIHLVEIHTGSKQGLCHIARYLELWDPIFRDALVCIGNGPEPLDEEHGQPDEEQGDDHGHSDKLLPNREMGHVTASFEKGQE